MTHVRPLRSLTVRALAAAALAVALLPATATPAQAAEATITGVAQDTNGKPLTFVHWEIHELVNGTWSTGLQFGPKLTDENGRFSWKMPVGGTYRVCFSDTYYDRANTPSGYWQPEVRHRDTCWPNATTLESAQSWTPTAANQSKTFAVKMPRQGLGMAPVEPFVNGTYEIGKPLTVVGQEGWRPTNATFTYRWMQRQGNTAATPIPGATGSTFTPTAAQNGKWVWAEVTASRTGYKPVTLNTPLTQAGGTHVQITSPLTITGSATPGSTITAAYGKPANTYGAIEWFVDGVPLPDGPSYDTASWPFTVTSAHAGALVEARLSIHAKDGDGNYIDGSNSFHRTTVRIPGQRPATALPAAPAPTGNATVGKVLRAPANPTVDPAATLTYQWLRGSTPIAGASRSTYTLTKADLGKPVSVRVTATRPGWWNKYVTTSRATVAKGAIKVGKVPLSGKARVGKKLKVTVKGWGPKPVKVRYQWLRNGKSIKGATKATYTLKKADRNKKVKVRATVSKARYTTVKKSSRSVKVKR